MISSIFKIYGRAKAQSRATYIMHKQPPQKLIFLFFGGCCFLISHTNHLDEKVEAIPTADISHMLYLVSVKLELKYTLIIAWEKRQNSLDVRSHTYLLWVHNLKDKNELKVMFLFKANRIQILEVSVYKTLPHSYYYTLVVLWYCAIYSATGISHWKAWRNSSLSTGNAGTEVQEWEETYANPYIFRCVFVPEEQPQGKLYINVVHVITQALLIWDFCLLQHGERLFFTHQHHHQ